MRYALALVCAACVLALTPFALADEGNTTAVPAAPACTPIKSVYAEKHWREAKPARGVDVCPAHRKAGGQNTVRHFYEYRHYRQIATVKCLPGREGWFVKPCYVIQCESQFNWWAENPSGAKWIYQLLGWGAPAPTSFHNRLVNHEIADGLSLSNWACA